MSIVVLLFIVGILLLCAEVIVPGAILGSVGALMIFAGCVTAFLRYGAGAGMLATFAALLLGGLAFFVQFQVLPKTKFGKRAFLTKQITATSNDLASRTQALVGLSAEAVTRLSPSGYVVIDGQRYEAFCQAGQAAAGTILKVVAADNFRLIVTPLNPHS